MKKANLYFTKFVKRMTYFYKKKRGANLKYIAVIEFQKRGAVHYHIVFFNLPFLRKEKIAEIWKHGFIKIKKVEHVDNIGAYMSKYMTKAFLDKHLQGKKRYFASKELKKPILIKDERKAFYVSQNLPPNMLRKESTYASEYQERVHYRQYNLGIGKTLSDFIDFPLE